MLRSFVCGVALVFAVVASAEEKAGPATLGSVIEDYLYSGQFAAGETAAMLALDEAPEDDSLRFGLGVIQFMGAVEGLGQALYEYGAISQQSRQPFLRLPVPKNDRPSAISYQELGRVLDCFRADLQRAEATLAEVKDDQVKLPLKLNRIAFQFGGPGKGKTQVVRVLDARRVDLKEVDPDLLIHFDRGDVAWLRAYCHLMMGLVDVYRAVDEKPGFSKRVGAVFPKLEAPEDEPELDWESGANIINPPRLRRMRLHFLAVCELNRETWEHIRAETDDDHEWLPHSGQTDQLGLPISKQQIDAWLAMMLQLEGILSGEILIPSFMLRFVSENQADGKGLNAKRLLDDPPIDMLNQKRLREHGIAKKYLDDEAGRKLMDFNAIIGMSRFFNGPFAFARAARLN